MTETGRGIQVVKIKEDHSYELDKEALGQVLLHEDVKDLPVVVISVAGAYRSGKSFLLNFFLRYLTSPQSAREDGSWLGEGSEPLFGFSWRGGSERHTTGILLWSEQFINTLPSGEKVAVILMDTQGTFDHKSTVRDNSTIFALSTLLSSVQIYNLSANIKEDDLQYLQLFTMYGKMVQEKQHQGKAFQVLEFLVRDWPNSHEHPYGADGGNKLLLTRLEITSDQAPELIQLREHIRCSFEKVLCFLMPHPGLRVTKNDFKGNISDLYQEFRIYLQELVLSLLSSENLTPKTINGEKVKAGELFNYFKAYMCVFNSDKILQPISIMEATIETILLSSTNKARDVYETGMNIECGPTKPGIPPVDVQELHEKYINEAIKVFTKKRTMATQEQVNECVKKLKMELEKRLHQFEQSNLLKLEAVIKQASEVYEQMIYDVSKNQPLCLHPLDLEAVHREAVQAALKIYDEHVKRISKKIDQKRVEYIKSFEVRLANLKIINDKNNKDVMKDIHMEYWKFMESKSIQPPLSDADFKREHNLGLSQALASLRTGRNRTYSYSNDVYEEDLTKIINSTFTRIQAYNLYKIEQENVRKEEERLKLQEAKLLADQAKAKEELEQRAKEKAIDDCLIEKEKVKQMEIKLHQEIQVIREEERVLQVKKKTLMTTQFQEQINDLVMTLESQKDMETAERMRLEKSLRKLKSKIQAPVVQLPPPPCFILKFLRILKEF